VVHTGGRFDAVDVSGFSFRNNYPSLQLNALNPSLAGLPKHRLEQMGKQLPDF
jgi:hypothetical protein